MKQHYTNNTDKPIFVSGKLIQPGLTRLVDVIETAPVDKPFDYAALLAAPVKDLPAKLADLSLAELEGALGYENANQKRKGAIDAIKTAIDDLEVNLDLSEFARSLSGVEDLDELLLKVAGNDAKVAMVEHEKSLRAENQ